MTTRWLILDILDLAGEVALDLTTLAVLSAEQSRELLVAAMSDPPDLDGRKAAR